MLTCVCLGWTTLIDWAEAADDERVRSVSIDTTNEWEKLAKERGSFLPFVFLTFTFN